MVAQFRADARPVLDQAFGPPADDNGTLRPSPRNAAQQDKMGV